MLIVVDRVCLIAGAYVPVQALIPLNRVRHLAKVLNQVIVGLPLSAWTYSNYCWNSIRLRWAMDRG